ncbi:putative methionine adenosyltransferase 2 subunit beta [Amylocarpus encephaloides]|uniref:Methionine adenosyltransferase 2 subunit beta n=1 Tax=Amylocarpus encephaloides TaxID=45428 RepID=A0A9P8C4S7_9HELO|nr:putative methionine adenosyltransferase 2 subunit beta [Amylocarpus encephaloides]
MAKTALITGATGLLGRQVVTAYERAGWDVKCTGLSRAKPPTILKVDLCAEAEVAKTLDDVRPSVVVHCAANRFPDKCDRDPVATRALNIAASASLAKLCAAQSIFLIYISTDYVFPGTEGDAPYEVTSTPNPPNLYGETKLEGEKAVLSELEKAGRPGWAVVLRVPVLYGEAEKPEESAVNVLMNSVWKAQEHDAAVAMDHWALRYPTNTEDVARVCQDISTKYLAAEDKTSLPTILQFSSEDRFTKYELCELFADIMGLPLDGMKANTEGNDPNASVKRPYDCHLSSTALKDLGINVATMDLKGWWRREARAYRK